MNIILDKIKYHLQASIPFAVYSKPESDVVTGLFQQEESTNYLDDHSSQGFVFAPFAAGKKMFIPSAKAEVVKAVIDSIGFSLAEPQQPETDSKAKNTFEALVVKSVAAIHSGKFEKLVVSRKETALLKDADILRILKNLLFAYPRAFCYCFYTPETGLWMGATPEQLLKANGTTIHTVALAGTQLYKEGEEAIWHAKEKQEQQFVTDYILEELKPFAAGVETTDPYTYRAGNIVHIKTDITAKLKDDTSLKDVMNTLHPTPAVCGLPKAEAKQFLLQNEGYDREYYSGFLGELNYDFATGEEGKTDLFVNLRCMKIEDNKAHLYIGCGITKDSDPEKEFVETVNKSMTMRRVL
jgi:isochorismate synthase